MNEAKHIEEIKEVNQIPEQMESLYSALESLQCTAERLETRLESVLAPSSPAERGEATTCGESRLANFLFDMRNHAYRTEDALRDILERLEL